MEEKVKRTKDQREEKQNVKKGEFPVRKVGARRHCRCGG